MSDENTDGNTEFDLNTTPAELTAINKIEQVPTITLEVPMEMKTLKVGAKNEIEVTFTLKDFPIEDKKTIFGNEKGTGSIAGQLAYAKKNGHTFMASIVSIQPNTNNDDEN